MASGNAIFETLIKRDVARGELNLHQLFDAYLDAPNVRHPGALNDSAVDLKSLVSALRVFPIAALEASHWMLVDSLNEFSVEAQKGRAGHTAYLDPETLMWAVGSQSENIVDIVCALCTVMLEGQKVPLLAGDIIAQMVALENTETADESDDAKNEDDEGLLPESSENTADTLMTKLAFALGLTEAELFGADEQSSGALWTALLDEKAIPSVKIHSQLKEKHRHTRAINSAESLLTHLASQNLHQRNLAFWFGPSILCETLSPYTRDIESVLWAWGEKQPAYVGQDIRPQQSSADLYAIAMDFLAHDSGLRAEKREADRSVGIEYFEGDGISARIIDTAKLATEQVDARLLGHIAQRDDAPVIVCLPSEASISLRPFIAHIFGAVKTHIYAVAALLPKPQAHPEAQLSSIQRAEHYSGLKRCYFDEDVPGMPTEWLKDPIPVPLQTLPSRRLALLKGGLENSGPQEVLWGLDDARFEGSLSSQSSVFVMSFAGPPRFVHRPQVSVLASQIFIATSWLRQLLSPPAEVRAETSVPPPKDPSPRRPSKRAIAMRIKA